MAGMSEVFAEKCPVKPEDIRTTPPEERKRILEELDRNLAIAQEEFEAHDTRVIIRSYR